jgi:hypothetical protein
MSRQFAVQASTQPSEGMGVIFLNHKLPRQLPVDRFDQRADGVLQILKGSRDLFFLVGARDRTQDNPIFCPQGSGYNGTDITLVSQHFQIGMFAQQFKPSFQIGTVGRGQFKIEDQTTQGDQQMQAIVKEGLFFGAFP